MILTKEKTKIKNKIFNKKPFYRIKNILLAISIASGLFITCNAVIFSTNVIKTSNLVESKIGYYNNLNNYSNFYKAMESVPYTENDFKKDLSLFEYLYVKNNSVSNAIFHTDKVGFYNFIEMRLKYSDRQDFLPKFLKETSFMNTNDIVDENSYKTLKSIRVYKELLNDNKGGALKFNRIISSTFILGGNNNLSNFNLIKDEINNIREYTINKGFSPDLYSISANLISRNIEEEKLYNNKEDYTKVKESRDKFSKEKNRLGEANISTLLGYYNNKEYDKLREVFKIGNAFSKVMIENAPTLEREGVYPEYITNYVNDFYDGDILSNSVLKFSDIKGAVNKENKQYYENNNLFYWF